LDACVPFLLRSAVSGMIGFSVVSILLPLNVINERRNEWVHDVLNLALDFFIA
jgi:hypothetical protein